MTSAVLASKKQVYFKLYYEQLFITPTF